MTAQTPDAPNGGNSTPPTVLIDGVRFHVIDERDGLIQVHRPNGVKLYWAKRLPDSPLYGENRGRFVPTPVGGSNRTSGVRS